MKRRYNINIEVDTKNFEGAEAYNKLQNLIEKDTKIKVIDVVALSNPSDLIKPMYPTWLRKLK